MNGKTAKYLQELPALVCVYCGQLDTTRDHVVASAILARPLPVNALTVPSCRDCNGRFSKDEQYFTAVLGMIGHTPQIEERIKEGSDIYRTLERSPKLDDRLISSVLYLHELGVPRSFRLRKTDLHCSSKKWPLAFFSQHTDPRLFLCSEISGHYTFEKPH